MRAVRARQAAGARNVGRSAFSQAWKSAIRPPSSIATSAACAGFQQWTPRNPAIVNDLSGLKSAVLATGEPAVPYGQVAPRRTRQTVEVILGLRRARGEPSLRVAGERRHPDLIREQHQRVAIGADPRRERRQRGLHLAHGRRRLVPLPQAPLLPDEQQHDEPDPSARRARPGASTAPATSATESQGR